MRTVLSRVAARMYWLGRYLERVDATARLIDVNTDLMMDLPTKLPLGWRPLIDITGSGVLFDELYGPDADASEHNVSRFLCTDARNPGAIVNSIANVRDNARHVRETMPRVTFAYFNELHLFAKSELASGQSRVRRREALVGIRRRTREIEGFLSQHMLHDAHWDMLRLGNYIERADMTTRIIDVRSADLFASEHNLEPFQHIQWSTVLRSFYAMQSYRATVRDAVSPPLVLEFLFKNEQLPASYVRSLIGVQRSLRSLPRNQDAERTCALAINAVRDTDVSDFDDAGVSIDRETAARERLLARAPSDEASGNLREFVDRCQRQVAAIHDAIVATYFD